MHLVFTLPVAKKLSPNDNSQTGHVAFRLRATQYAA
jgi:hypothetical protein